jgi:GDP-mannose 6-dehydrogenase
MKVAVFGLGYVGCITGACLAAKGHTVIGVDIQPFKVELVNQGRSPVVEPGLESLIRKVVTTGHLRATLDPNEAVTFSDVSLICVNTPSHDDGSLDTQYLERVCLEIGMALSKKTTYHVVAVRSTVLPGTTEKIVIPLLEKSSGKRAGINFGVAVNPEFLREGTGIEDFYNPPRVLIGELDTNSGDIVASLYDGINAPLVRTDLRVSEMVKYVDNAFLALKVAFANEIGNLCKHEGIDSHEVMKIFCLDTKFNLSPSHLKPGFAFGGPCLPKDLRALLHRAKERGLEVPLLNAIMRSNELQKRIAIELIQQTGKRRIGVLGLAFKAGTDDLRESPIVELVETLLDKGYQVSIYDPLVSPSILLGANKIYVERHLPDIGRLMRQSIDEILQEAEVLVITQNKNEFMEIIRQLHEDQIIIDFVRIVDQCDNIQKRYYGICW